jgi:hypothetical protein
VAAIGLLHGIHRKRADRISHQLSVVRHGCLVCVVGKFAA